jgi:FkbM family methyltransferase
MLPVPPAVQVRRALNKPHYLFRPSQLLRRVRGLVGRPSPASTIVELPWGLPIRIRPRDMIGSSIVRTGVYDLTVSEVILRLLDPGEHAVDVGANIGYMTNLCAARVGPKGQVIAVEPHPEIARELRGNIELISADPTVGPVAVEEVALSDVPGRGTLATGPEFRTNRGTAKLTDADSAPGDEASSSHIINITTLDALVRGQPVSVLKVDVEGHELQVLRGADVLLSSGNVRDVLFEDHGTPPTPVTEFLSSLGYTIMRMHQQLMGPSVEPIARGVSHSLWDPPSYVGTIDPARLASRLSPRGWRVLSRSWR